MSLSPAALEGAAQLNSDPQISIAMLFSCQLSREESLLVAFTIVVLRFEKISQILFVGTFSADRSPPKFYHGAGQTRNRPRSGRG
jgi:hypothetical protein